MDGEETVNIRIKHWHKGENGGVRPFGWTEYEYAYSLAGALRRLENLTKGYSKYDWCLEQVR